LGRRVLFFGVTGIEKRSALHRLAEWARDHRSRQPRPKVIDFEAEYLFKPARGGERWHSFLDAEQRRQRQVWQTTWTRFNKEVLADPGAEDVYISLHGCIVRGHYGVRCVADVNAVARDAKPDLVVTLLDDVYDLWWRTEARAGGSQRKGRPTIEQLLFARRVELIVADQVAHSLEPPAEHFVISVAHPCETLGNRIYGPSPIVVYLCFPISAPRDLKREGDPAGEAAILGFLKTAYDRQAKNPNLVCVCPLAIDELPLLAALDRPENKTEVRDAHVSLPAIKFDRDALRWDLTSVWSPAGMLCPGPPAAAERAPIPEEQLKAASGMIHSDVGWRDYRLVSQSAYLAAFNPKFRNRGDLSRSVHEEIRFATSICPVFVYQDPEHDPDGVVKTQFPQESGTMPRGPQTCMVELKESVEHMFDDIEHDA
jgi:hypothetical protein